MQPTAKCPKVQAIYQKLRTEISRKLSLKPFANCRHGGTGLGLCIVRTLVSEVLHYVLMMHGINSM
jgi:hypothetical protein